MAPSRGKGKTRASTSRNSQPRTRKAKNDVPDVYRDLLAEAAATDPSDTGSERPLKKRKVAPKAIRTAGGSNGVISKSPGRNTQTIEASSDSGEDSGESDFAFEDVDLEPASASSPAIAAQVEDGIADVSVSVDTAGLPKRQVHVKRKPFSPAEKAFRLLIHKSHILCLLGHCLYVNTWCNNAVVQRHLKSVLKRKTKSYLNHNVDDSQFQRNRSFMDGLQQASQAFRAGFQITAPGMRRARWLSEGESTEGRNDADPMDRADFIAAAEKLEGSQDTANQLFCALLRLAGVDARLVCSLQALPFANVPSNAITPSKLPKPTVFAMASGTESAASDSNNEDKGVAGSASIGKVPSARRRLGHPTLTPEPATLPMPSKKRPIRRLTFPVFWVEAFNTAHQKWVPVDPMVTQTVGKASKFEPPSSYAHNQMSYVLAFEPDGAARDVTRRYTRAYNAKTRRSRIESTEGGDRWMKKALRIFRPRHSSDEQRNREQVEDAELAQREAREGLPANVLDFKGHPYYALERHCKRHEVIHPRREVGKVNAGTAAKPRMEAVYRRQDVVPCRSADKWYKVGRVVKEAEQALKHVPSMRSSARRAGSEDEDQVEGPRMTALYAPYQTDVYIPPPVSPTGKVPRNAYGTLDIYVPSMVPAGGSHIPHLLAKRACKEVLRVDCVDAVTGFQFKGRQGEAVKEGVIVASRYADAVWAVIEGLEDERVEDEGKARSLLALKLWRRFLKGLEIKERVAAYGEAAMDQDEVDDQEDAGGFLPGDNQDEQIALPTAGMYSIEELTMSAASAKSTKSKKKQVDESEEEAELTPSEVGSLNADEGYTPTTQPRSRRRRFIDDDDEHELGLNNEDDVPMSHDRNDADDEGTFGDEYAGGSGFIAEDGVGGGFLPEAVDNGGGGGFVTEDGDFENDGGGIIVLEDEVLDDTMTALKDYPGDDRGRYDTEMAGGFSPGEDETQRREGWLSSVPERAIAEIIPSENLKDGADDTSLPQQQNDSASSRTPEADRVKRPIEEMGLNVDDHPESDRGSMLSHDPDDEDAEPDWLESD